MESKGSLTESDLADPNAVGYLTAMREVQRLEEALKGARAVADKFAAAMDVSRTGPARGLLGRLACELGIEEQTVKNHRQRGARQ